MVFGPPPTATPPKRRSSVFSCAGCGCALLIVILLLLGTLAFSAYRMALRMTSATAIPVPEANGGPEVYAAAQKKIADFRQAIEYAQPATLQLNSDEINTYIARDPSMASVRGHLFVHLENGDATLQSDLQLGNFEKYFLTERYIDGTANLSFVFHPEDSTFVVDLHSLTFKGQPVPASAVANVSQAFNNAIEQQIQAHGPIRDFLARTQKITIDNDELVIVTR